MLFLSSKNINKFINNLQYELECDKIIDFKTTSIKLKLNHYMSFKKNKHDYVK